MTLFFNFAISKCFSASSAVLKHTFGGQVNGEADLASTCSWRSNLIGFSISFVSSGSVFSCAAGGAGGGSSTEADDDDDEPFSCWKSFGTGGVFFFTWTKLIHWHISCLLRRSSSIERGDWSLFVWCCFCFVSCSLCLRLHPVCVDSGLSNGPRSFFDSPMRDADSCNV